jgi:hypothetical protein
MAGRQYTIAAAVNLPRIDIKYMSPSEDMKDCDMLLYDIVETLQSQGIVVPGTVLLCCSCKPRV